MSQFDEKKEDGLGSNGLMESGGSDSERQGPVLNGNRKMSRIGPPAGGTTYPGGDGSVDEKAALVEMEEGNAIKYRTCSWQKVCKVLVDSESQSCPIALDPVLSHDSGFTRQEAWLTDL